MRDTEYRVERVISISALDDNKFNLSISKIQFKHFKTAHPVGKCKCREVDRAASCVVSDRGRHF